MFGWFVAGVLGLALYKSGNLQQIIQVFQHAIPQSTPPQNSTQSFAAPTPPAPINNIYRYGGGGAVGIFQGKTLGGDAPGVGGLSGQPIFSTQPAVVLIQNGMAIPVKTVGGTSIAGTATKQFGTNLISPLGP